MIRFPGRLACSGALSEAWALPFYLWGETLTGIGSPEENKRLRGVFFDSIFGKHNGWVCLAFLPAADRKKFREEYYRYPEETSQMLDAVEANLSGNNIYFCPQLLSEKRRQKQYVSSTPNLWSDLDFCEPANLLVEPTVTIESSPDRYQAYWVLDKVVDVDDAEDLSKRIAYKHADQGADRTGWDLTQLLRVPLTYNYKYNKLAPPVVKTINFNRTRYRISDFEEYPKVEGYAYVDVEMPDISEYPNADELLDRRRLQLNPRVWHSYSEEPAEDWSGVLWNLHLMLLEAGYDRNETFIIVREAKCNKYVRDGKSEKLLWKEVVRADTKNELNLRLIAGIGDNEDSQPLLSDKERSKLERDPDTFIERFQQWARSLGDAAPQYHQAGAFVALSSLLAGAVRLPTSFGTIIPNLWFMILADTTLTRKSTAMDIAIDMVMEIDPDSMLATDGSLEGLLTALSMRPGKPSIFLRDEFSGLLEMITKKDYYSGMPELLTKLYDGKMQKRILRKETIEVREPILIFFAGGIKDKITGLLTHEHVSSGFMPRFVFITAESDINRLKPIGPPTATTTGSGDAIRNELMDIFSYYRKPIHMTVQKTAAVLDEPMKFEAELTGDAWVRYNILESDMLSAGLAMEKPDMMTPTYDRLSKSILKAAILLSAARQRSEKLVVEEIDIIRAISYGEQWRTHANEVMINVGKGTYERQLDTIVRAIERTPGVTRSKIMQWYHLSSRSASEMFDTLEQRGAIKRIRAGRTETFHSLR